MKKTIIALGAVALICTGYTARADEPNSGHTADVTPGDWDDDDPKLNFNFKDIPVAKYSGLRLTLSCGIPDAKILFTTDPDATPDNAEAWSVYTEPLYLTSDCTVRFFARCEGYNDSQIQSYSFVYSDHQTAAPDIAPDIERTGIVMSSDTPHAIIHYTFEGGEPDEASPTYDGTVTIKANGTYRARAFADGLFPSAITEYTVDFMKTPNPTAAFDNKQLAISITDPEASIRYSINPGADIANADEWFLYSSPIALTEDCTVRYYGHHEGYHDSDVQEFSFVYSSYQVAAPRISADAAGTHIVMTCDTQEAEIRYTNNGDDPTQQSILYSAPVEISSNGTFRARAFAEGLFDSNIVDFTVMHMAVPTPTAAFENKRLSISCADSNATVWYTTDINASASDLSGWTEYNEPVALTEDCTVRFFGRRDGFNDSDVQSFAFIYSNYQVADPSIERNDEGTHIVMESATPGASIHFTTDGNQPTAESPVYTRPILIEGNFTYTAIAIADGMFDSKPNRYVVSSMAVPVPFANFENLKMTLSCADEKAQIWYTINPNATVDDISGWTLYTAPFEMTGDCTLRFFSRRDNFNDSDIESLSFVYSAYQAQAPSIERNDQGTHIVMATAVEGGKIRYTSDGSEPNAESELYSAPVRIQEGAVYRARVFADNMYGSEISEYAIGNDKLAVPTAAYDNFTLVLSSTDEGAGIWWTTDPDLSLDNVEAWIPYESPIALGDDCTYRFFAGDDDANASDIQTFVFQKSDWQVAVPTIERNEAGTHIVMETPTEGAEIRYTTDGSEPTEKSELYTAPILINGNGSYRARAFLKGLYDSEVTDFIVANMACPVAYAKFENKVLTLTCEDPEVEIWYTNDDDAVPDEMENWQLYTSPIALTENCWVHFFTRRENFNDSDIETFVFLRANYLASAPSIERSEDGREIVMSTDTEGAEIRYTTDGSEPTEASDLYTGPVFITQNCTFRARTFADGLFESDITEYTVGNMTMMMPHANFENLLLILSVWDESASVWYTLDPDAAPVDSEAWTLYTEPIALESDCTVRFFARRTGFLDSQINTFEFVYADYQVAAPELSAKDGVVTITCETEGAEIRYTLDGTEPTPESKLYTEPIELPGNCTVKAIAVKDGMYDSKISEITVSDLTVANPTATFEDLALTLAVDDENAQIFYTNDAEATPENAEAWTLYDEPLTFDGDCTVRYFARRDNFNDSEVMSFEHIYADWQVDVPEITADAESKTVAISCPTEGAEIRYTTDGREPTEESALYTGPLAAENDMVIRARAFADGLYDSEISELTVSGFSGVGAIKANGFKVCKEGGDAVVYADKEMCIGVYTLDGHLVRLVNVEAGRNVIDDLDSNVYVIAGVRIKL